MSPRPPLDGPDDPRRTLPSSALEEAQFTGYPVVASQYKRRDRAGLMLGGSIALLLGAATLFAMSNTRTHPTASPPANAVTQPPPVGVAQQVAPQPQPQPVAALPTAAPAPPAPLPQNAYNPAFRAQAALDRARAPALVFDNSPTVGASTGPIAAAPPAAAKAPPPALTPDEQFAQRFGNDGESVSATQMVNPSATIAQGTLMSAVLETAIDSDLPGYVRAVISRDVKSYDGTRVLIPRGSHVIGEYKSGLAVGQTRAYVLWTRLLRPDGVSVALGSPATDSSGRNGLGGKVSSHFGKRFGAAILLSAIGAVGQAIGGGNSAIVIAGPQQAVSSTAQQNLAIPPTVRVSLGKPIRIFTARDLDFSAVITEK